MESSSFVAKSRIYILFLASKCGCLLVRNYANCLSLNILKYKKLRKCNVFYNKITRFIN